MNAKYVTKRHPYVSMWRITALIFFADQTVITELMPSGYSIQHIPHPSGRGVSVATVHRVSIQVVSSVRDSSHLNILRGRLLSGLAPVLGRGPIYDMCWHIYKYMQVDEFNQTTFVSFVNIWCFHSKLTMHTILCNININLFVVTSHSYAIEIGF